MKMLRYMMVAACCLTLGVGLAVSQEETAICVVDQDGAILAEAKVATCPDAIVDGLAGWSNGLERVGMETGPLAVWLWNALTARGLHEDDLLIAVSVYDSARVARMLEDADIVMSF